MEDSSRSSPAAAGDDSFVMADAGSQIGSAAGSFQNEGLLAGSGGAAAAADAGIDAEFGFQRPEFRQGKLVGTVHFHERHVFLCYKGPQVWPSHVEAAESDRLPRLLSAAIANRKADMGKRTGLTICEGEDGTESSNGDVLIFPDLIRYRRLTHFDVDNFVEEVLVKDTEWLPGAPEPIKGSYVFVCAHGSRDRRCGVCGPALIKKFKEEINLRGLQGQVSVSACSHIGGHKYAGNVIIFSPDVNGEVTGHWYGYVAPDDVSTLLEQHIGKGEIVEHLWRGQMGLSKEQQEKALELRHQPNGATEKSTKETLQSGSGCSAAGGCCQTGGNFTCSQNGPPLEASEKSDEQNPKRLNGDESEKESKVGTDSRKASSSRKFSPMPKWYETWEREDTYAALAVVAAVASVFVAYSFYKNLK